MFVACINDVAVILSATRCIELGLTEELIEQLMKEMEEQELRRTTGNV